MDIEPNQTFYNCHQWFQNRLHRSMVNIVDGTKSDVQHSVVEQQPLEPQGHEPFGGKRGLLTAPLGPTYWLRQWGGRCESEGEGKGKHNQRRDEGTKGR